MKLDHLKHFKSPNDLNSRMLWTNCTLLYKFNNFITWFTLGVMCFHLLNAVDHTLCSSLLPHNVHTHTHSRSLSRSLVQKIIVHIIDNWTKVCSIHQLKMTQILSVVHYRLLQGWVMKRNTQAHKCKHIKKLFIFYLQVWFSLHKTYMYGHTCANM